MRIIHWVVMLINLMFCLSVMILAKRTVGKIRRENDSICGQISRDGRTEIHRLGYLVQAHEGTIRDHEEQIADRENTINILRKVCDQHAKRILSLEDSYRVKCKEVEEMDWEVFAGRDTRDAALELSEILSRFLKRMDKPLPKNIFSPATFQPKRPEDQPPKPTCDN
jgi:hypothetical protein